MSAMARWCYRRRRFVLIMWLLVFVALGVLGRSAGSTYATSFALPATDSTRALNLLKAQFPAASGEADSIVLHVNQGKVTDAAIQARVAPVLTKISKIQHVKAVLSPYSTIGARQVSKDGKTAFATVTFDGTGRQIPKTSVNQVIDAADSARSGPLQVELGGASIQNAKSKGFGL